MISELSSDNITPILAEIPPKVVKIAILVHFDVFFARIWVKLYLSSILRPYLEPCHQGELFIPPIKK